MQSESRLVPAADVASLFGYTETALLELLASRKPPSTQEFYSITDLATRWRCSRGTVYNRLRDAGAKALDFSKPGKKARRAVRADVVHQLELRYSKRIT